MLSYEEVKKNPNRFRACTSLDVDEFEQLVPHFEQAWITFAEENFIKGKERQCAYGGGRKATLTKVGLAGVIKVETPNPPLGLDPETRCTRQCERSDPA